MEKPKKRKNTDNAIYLKYNKGYNNAWLEWNNYHKAYLESISEQKLYCAILDVQESLERKGEDISLLQSHRKMMARLIKHMIDGGE